MKLSKEHAEQKVNFHRDAIAELFHKHPVIRDEYVTIIFRLLQKKEEEGLRSAASYDVIDTLFNYSEGNNCSTNLNT